MTTFLEQCNAFADRAGDIETREELHALVDEVVGPLVTELVRPIAGRPEAADFAYKLEPLVGAMLLRTVIGVLRDSEGS